MTELSAYRDAVLEDIGAAVVSPSGQQVNVGPSQRTQWFQLVPRVPGEYVEAAYVTIVTSVTTGATTYASVAGAVQLDAQLLQIFVAPQANSAPRSYTSSRLASQEVERLVFAMDDASISYPGTAVATIASVTTVTLTNSLLVPVGGQGAAIAFQTGAIGAAYTGSSATLVSTFTVRTVSGLNPTVITFKDDFTNSLASAAAVDITTYLNDANLSAQWLDFVGCTTATLQGLSISGADGSFLVDFNSGAESYTAGGSIPQLQKYIGKSNYLSASTAFYLRRQGVWKASANLAAAGALEVLRIEADGGPEVGQSAAPAPTAAPPASQQTGKAVAGNITVVQSARTPLGGRMPTRTSR
jgi:hypothetical protein